MGKESLVKEREANKESPINEDKIKTRKQKNR